MNVNEKLLQESFSAWLDDESDDLDMQRLVNYLQSDRNVEADLAFERQARLKDVLQGWGGHDVSDAVFKENSARTSLALVPPSTGKWQVIKGVPWTLVASFALLVAILVPVFQQDDWIQDGFVTYAVQQQELVVETEKLASSQSRMNQYFQKHLLQSSLSSGHISLPFQTAAVMGG